MCVLFVLQTQEDKKRIDTLCHQARVTECAHATAVAERDRARMQKLELEEASPQPVTSS